MKISMIALAALVMSSSAFAMPSVGDDAVFALTATVNGQTYTGTGEEKLVAFDAASNNWTEQNTFVISGQTQTQNQTVQTNQLLTHTTVAAVMSNCAAYGGTPQSITVPAGTYNTCSLPVNSNGQTGTVWVASGIAFGMVQSDITTASNGQHTVLKLISATAALESEEASE
jgi:hypothetical protein